MAIDVSDYPVKVRANLWSDKPSERFFYRFKINNKTYRGVFDFSSKGWNKKDRLREAEFQLLEARARAKDEIDDSATVNKIVEMYFETVEDGNYKRNRESYYKRKVQKQLGSKRAAMVIPAHIQKIVNENIKNGDSPATAKQAIEVLSPAFNIARANRIVTHNPCKDVKIKLPPQKKIVTNATQRLKQIYDAIMSLYSEDPFYRAFFLLTLQGRRKGEVRGLQWEDIVFEYDYYVIRETKNDEEQKIFLPPNVKAALEEFRGEEGPVFRSRVTGKAILDVKRPTAKLKKKLGDWFTVHFMRNVMVSAMAEKGVDAIYMSGALGHNDPNTITKYLTMNYMQGSKIASDMIQ